MEILFFFLKEILTHKLVKEIELVNVFVQIQYHHVNDEFLVHNHQQQLNEVYNVPVKVGIQHHLIY